MSGCGATCGINKERERERERALAAVARAYPELVWSADAAGAVLPMGMDADAVLELGRELEELLPVRAIYRPATGSGGCDWLYLLAGLHAPSLVEVADGLAPAADPELRAEETYVRLGFSALGRYVTIQEVVLRLSTDEADGTQTLVEAPCMGVVDRRLQAIVKGLQGKLRKARVVVLDMAFLAQSVAEAVPSAAPQEAFVSAFGAEPSLFSFLFDAEPPSATRAMLVGARTRAESR